jgi:hypothetical protein
MSAKMSTLTIKLPADKVEELAELAAQLGISLEELVNAAIEHQLSAPDGEFKNAAHYVLKKNAELYRRLGEQA